MSGIACLRRARPLAILQGFIAGSSCAGATISFHMGVPADLIAAAHERDIVSVGSCDEPIGVVV